MGKRRGRVKSRNMYKGPMDKDNGGRSIEYGRCRVGRAGESNGGGMGIIVIEKQKKRIKSLEKKIVVTKKSEMRNEMRKRSLSEKNEILKI